MTKAFSSLDDNGGLCESCNDPETKHKVQRTHPVFLGGGLGWGTMWMCDACYNKRTSLEEIIKRQRFNPIVDITISYVDENGEKHNNVFKPSEFRINEERLRDGGIHSTIEFVCAGGSLPLPENIANSLPEMKWKLEDNKSVIKYNSVIQYHVENNGLFLKDDKDGCSGCKMFTDFYDPNICSFHDLDAALMCCDKSDNIRISLNGKLV
jgi:hypothetical protein